MIDELISKELLLNDLDSIIAQYNWEDDGVIMDILACVRDMVFDQPTAYDIDRVIEQLEELKETAYESYGLVSGAYVAMCNAIEIVKEGGTK